MPIILPCDSCGKLLSRSPSQVTGHVFCDKECRRTFITTPLEERFWQRVEKTAICWLWKGGCSQHGYGIFSTTKRADNPRKYHQTVAHRMAWELTYGPIPPGQEVCHNCPGGDNPRCVNPDHLFLGTQADNMRDAVRKGRHYSHPRKLSDAQAVFALMMRGRLSQKCLARALGVTATAIQQLHERKTYKDIDMCSVEEMD